MPDGRALTFEALMRPGAEVFDPIDRLMLRRTQVGYELVDESGKRWLYREPMDLPRRSVGPRLLLPVAVQDTCDNRIDFHHERGYLRYVVDAAGRVLDIRWNAEGRIRERLVHGVSWLRGPATSLRRYCRARRPISSRSNVPSASSGTRTKPATLRGRRTRWVRVCATGGAKASSSRGETSAVSRFFLRMGLRPPRRRLHPHVGRGIHLFDPSAAADNPIPKRILDRRIDYWKERHMTVVEDGRGAVTQYFTNDLGLVEKEVGPRGEVTETTWSEDAWKLAEKNPLGEETTWTYDDRGRVIAVRNPLGETVRYAYDAQGNRTETLHPGGGVTTAHFDRRRLPVTVTNPAGDVTRIAYDERGHPVRVQDPMGRSVALAWTERHDVRATTDGEARVTERVYDTSGGSSPPSIRWVEGFASSGICSGVPRGSKTLAASARS